MRKNLHKLIQLSSQFSPKIRICFRCDMKHLEECFITYPNTSKCVKKTRLRLVFSTYFSVFWYAMKHSSSCFIYYIQTSYIDSYIQDSYILWIPSYPNDCSGFQFINTCILKLKPKLHFKVDVAIRFFQNMFIWPYENRQRNIYIFRLHFVRGVFAKTSERIWLVRFVNYVNTN